MVKIPQIMKILANKSAAGINFISVLLDLFAITCHMSYSYVRGFPFSAWGDGTFLAIQTAVIAALVLYYGGSPAKAGLFLTVYVAICYVLMGGLTPVEYLWSAQGFNVPILLVGKLTQAFTNYKNGSTGQLSAATCFMLFFGSMARIFTSIQETGDTMMIITYCVSTSANAVIISQLLYYWNKHAPVPIPSPTEKPKGKSITAKPKQKSKKVD